MEIFNQISISPVLYRSLKENLEKDKSQTITKYKSSILFGIKIIEDDTLPNNIIKFVFPDGRVEIHRIGE